MNKEGSLDYGSWMPLKQVIKLDYRMYPIDNSMFLLNNYYTYIHSILYNPTMFQGVTLYNKAAYDECK